MWQDIERIIKYFPELKERFTIIGNLRSPFGVNIMLYNLALNPHITDVVVWGPDRLSNTHIGLAGKQTLFDIWEKGTKAFKLVEQIDEPVLEKILKNVTLTEKSHEEKLDLAALKIEKKAAYMEPVVFKEFIPQAPDTFPSEMFSYPIRDQKGASAYLTLLHTVWKYGEKTKIDIESEEVKEIRLATVTVEHEDPQNIYLPDWLLKTESFGITRESLQTYYETQFSPELYTRELFPGVTTFERPRDYSYLYAELMYAFPRLPWIDESVWGLLEQKGYDEALSFIQHISPNSQEDRTKLINHVEKKIKDPKERITILLEGLVPRINQVDYVIERIKRKPVDLDKEIVLWDQRYHTTLESGRPCLFKFSFSVRNEHVDAHIFVRTHDIGRAWFFNFYGITKLLGNICAETNYKPGIITIESQSAHIYKRDWADIEEVVKKQVVEKGPRMFFDPETDSDPRGIVNVNVIDKKIKAKLQDTKTGKILAEVEGATAREVLYKLRHFKFISRVDHAAFIGSELAKAEVCIKLGIPYKFDNPVVLPNNEKIYS